VLEEVGRDQRRPGIAPVEEVFPFLDLGIFDILRRARGTARPLSKPHRDRLRLRARQRRKAERHAALGMLAELFLDLGEALRTRGGPVDVEGPAHGMGDPLTDEPPQQRVRDIVRMDAIDDRKETELRLPSSRRLRVLEHARRPVGDGTLRVVNDRLVPAAIEPLERLQSELARMQPLSHGTASTRSPPPGSRHRTDDHGHRHGRQPPCRCRWT
jgi:hypothetical protein